MFELDGIRRNLSVDTESSLRPTTQLSFVQKQDDNVGPVRATNMVVSPWPQQTMIRQQYNTVNAV